MKYNGYDLGFEKVNKARGSHNNQFSMIRPNLSLLYLSYKNRDKIIVLLDAWLYFVRAIYCSYGNSGIISFFNSQFNCPIRFSFQYELNKTLDNKVISISNFLLFRSLEYFLITALLPGAIVTKLTHKISWRFSKLVTMLVPIKWVPDRRNQIKSYVEDYFSDCHDSGMDDRSLCSILDAIPAVFYANTVSCTKNRHLNIKCSPWILFDFSGYERLLLLDRDLNVEGLQHGGSYFSCVTDICDKFEESISDSYFGWGLSPRLNRRQHRFHHREDLSIEIENSSKGRIIWVERNLVTRYQYYIWPSQVGAMYCRETIDYIGSELANSGLNYYNLLHPKDKENQDYVGLRGKIVKTDSKRGEQAITNNDVVIFDIIGSTLLHYCVEMEVIFLLVVARDAVHNYTSEQKQWFDVIRQCGLACYDDEIGFLRSRIIEIVSFNLTMPEELREFHNKHFIDI